MSPPVPDGCYCPPLDLPPQVDRRPLAIKVHNPPHQGGLVCAPPLLESGEGQQGAVCIFSCDQHPQVGGGLSPRIDPHHTTLCGQNVNKIWHNLLIVASQSGAHSMWCI